MSRALMVLAAVSCSGLAISAGCGDDAEGSSLLGGPGAIAEVDGRSCELAVEETAAWYLTGEGGEHFGIAGQHGESCLFEIEAVGAGDDWEAGIYFASAEGEVEVEDWLDLDSFEVVEADGELTGAFSGVFASDDQIVVSVEFEAIPWSEDTF